MISFTHIFDISFPSRSTQVCKGSVELGHQTYWGNVRSPVVCTMIQPFPLLLLITNLNIPIFSLPYYLEPKRRNSIVKQERVRSTSQLSPTKFPARHPRGSVVHPRRQQQLEVVERRRKRRRQLGRVLLSSSKQPPSRIASLLRRRSKNALQ